MKVMTLIVACVVGLLWMGCGSSAYATSHGVNTAAFAYTNAMFRTALAYDSTAPYYLLVTIRDGNTGATRQVCVEGPFLQAALQQELGLSYDKSGRRKANRFILSHPDHVFTLFKPEALANVAPRYTPAVLQEVRHQLAPYTQAQLRDPKIFGSIHGVPSKANHGAYRDATAHVLLEHGILCGQGDLTGSLYLAP